jgi:hypothetical protein
VVCCGEAVIAVAEPPDRHRFGIGDRVAADRSRAGYQQRWQPQLELVVISGRDGCKPLLRRHRLPGQSEALAPPGLDAQSAQGTTMSA